MEPMQLEEAIKSDLKLIPTLKMGFVSARDLYGRVFAVTFMLSLTLLAINTLVRFALKITGLYPITFTPGLMTGTWFVCFMTSLVLGFVLSRFILIGKLLKGRLKTANLMKQTFRYLALFGLSIYTGAYAFITVFVSFGMDDHIMDPWPLVFSTLFTQAIAFIAATGITGLLSGVELDRLGIGAVFNVISEMVSKSKKSPGI